jgi:hypothetical protein
VLGPTLTTTGLVAAIDRIAMASVVAAEDAVVADAAVAAEAKAEIVRAQRRAEHRWALAQKTRLLRKPHPFRRLTVLIAVKTLAMRALGTRLRKRLASGSRTIVRLHSRNSGRLSRSIRRHNPSTGRRRLHLNM